MDGNRGGYAAYVMRKGGEQMNYFAYFIGQITPQGVLAGFILGGALGFLAAREWYTAIDEDETVTKPAPLKILDGGKMKMEMIDRIEMLEDEIEALENAIFCVQSAHQHLVGANLDSFARDADMLAQYYKSEKYDKYQELNKLYEREGA